MKIKKIFNIPNSISFLRVIAVPFFVLAVLREQAVLTLLILILVIASDLVDGRLARKLKIDSTLGAVIDITCDSIFMLSALILFVIVGVFPLIAFVLLAFAAALKFGGMYIIYYFTKSIKSTMWSKLAGASIYILFFILIFNSPYALLWIYVVITCNLIIGVKRKIDAFRVVFHEIRTHKRRI